MFNIKQFNSGEYEVKLTERIRNNEVRIHWNYFEQKDVMIPILQASAIRRTYGDDTVRIILNAPYLPYARQDRVFEAGQSIPIVDLIKILKLYFDDIQTTASHSYSRDIFNHRYLLNDTFEDNYLVFPDMSAINHFNTSCDGNNILIFNKIRDSEGKPTLELDGSTSPRKINLNKRFIICDDIGDGNRTFVECAKVLKQNFEHGQNKIKIELLLYNAFCTYGLQNIIDAGISKLRIINEDSYNYLIKKFPEHKDFIQLQISEQLESI